MKSLYIRNFKNIRELTINRLAKVNLIVGKNSVGKSTLLEALSVYLTQGSDKWLRELLDNRGETMRNQSYNEDQEAFITQCYTSFFYREGREL